MPAHPKRGFSERSREDREAEAEPAPKQPKITKKTKSPAYVKKDEEEIETGTQFEDDEGNPFWELGKLKRATVSSFRDTTYVNIREYYQEKTSGKILPGKKGIMLNLEQWNALLSVLPQIDAVLGEQDLNCTRPVYGVVSQVKGELSQAIKPQLRDKKQGKKVEDSDDKEGEDEHEK